MSSKKVARAHDPCLTGLGVSGAVQLKEAGPEGRGDIQVPRITPEQCAPLGKMLGANLQTRMTRTLI